MSEYIASYFDGFPAVAACVCVRKRCFAALVYRDVKTPTTLSLFVKSPLHIYTYTRITTQETALLYSKAYYENDSPNLLVMLFRESRVEVPLSSDMLAIPANKEDSSCSRTDQPLS